MKERPLRTLKKKEYRNFKLIEVLESSIIFFFKTLIYSLAVNFLLRKKDHCLLVTSKRAHVTHAS